MSCMGYVPYRCIQVVGRISHCARTYAACCYVYYVCLIIFSISLRTPKRSSSISSSSRSSSCSFLTSEDVVFLIVFFWIAFTLDMLGALDIGFGNRRLLLGIFMIPIGSSSIRAIGALKRFRRGREVDGSRANTVSHSGSIVGISDTEVGTRIHVYEKQYMKRKVDKQYGVSDYSVSGGTTGSSDSMSMTRVKSCLHNISFSAS